MCPARMLGKVSISIGFGEIGFVWSFDSRTGMGWWPLTGRWSAARARFPPGYLRWMGLAGAGGWMLLWGRRLAVL